MRNRTMIQNISDYFNIILMDYADNNLPRFLSFFIFFSMIFPFINRKVKLFKDSQRIINAYRQDLYNSQNHIEENI